MSKVIPETSELVMRTEAHNDGPDTSRSKKRQRNSFWSDLKTYREIYKDSSFMSKHRISSEPLSITEIKQMNKQFLPEIPKWLRWCMTLEPSFRQRCFQQKFHFIFTYVTIFYSVALLVVSSTLFPWDDYFFKGSNTILMYLGMHVAYQLTVLYSFDSMYTSDREMQRYLQSIFTREKWQKDFKGVLRKARAVFWIVLISIFVTCILVGYIFLSQQNYISNVNPRYFTWLGYIWLGEGVILVTGIPRLLYGPFLLTVIVVSSMLSEAKKFLTEAINEGDITWKEALQQHKDLYKLQLKICCKMQRTIFFILFQSLAFPMWMLIVMYTSNFGGSSFAGKLFCFTYLLFGGVTMSMGFLVLKSIKQVTDVYESVSRHILRMPIEDNSVIPLRLFFVAYLDKEKAGFYIYKIRIDESKIQSFVYTGVSFISLTIFRLVEL